MAEWRIVKRTVSDGISFHIETQVASVYVTMSVIIVAMRNKTTFISNPAAVTA